MESENIAHIPISDIENHAPDGENISRVEAVEHLITKREATPDDRDFAFATHYSAYKDVMTRQVPTANYDKLQAYYFAKIWVPERFKVILDNESPCGLLWVEDMSDCIFIHELVVTPESQGLGIGTKIINETIQESQIRNVPIKLDVLKENKARGLYERIGFVITGESDIHFHMQYTPDSKE